jgi:hypothetical protein
MNRGFSVVIRGAAPCNKERGEVPAHRPATCKTTLLVIWLQLCSGSHDATFPDNSDQNVAALVRRSRCIAANEDCASEVNRPLLPGHGRCLVDRGSDFRGSPSVSNWQLVAQMRDTTDDGIPHLLARRASYPCFSCAQALRNQALGF